MKIKKTDPGTESGETTKECKEIPDQAGNDEETA